MPAAFKVRLEDGVEVGPLDGQMLRSWWQQGMVKRDTQVRLVGGTRWVRLSDAVDISDWGAAGGPAGRRGRKPGDDADEPEATDAGPSAMEPWRTFVAAAFLFSIAGAAAYVWFVPGVVLSSLRPAPWREIALGHLALGLTLATWEPMRKVVRVIVCGLTFSLMPLAAPIIVSGLGSRIDYLALATLFSAWVLGSGLFFFLAGRALPWKSLLLCLFWIVAGAVGTGYFGLVPGALVAAAR